MARWNFEQLQMHLAIPEMAKGTVGLLAVGLLFGLLFGTPRVGQRSSEPKTAEDFADRAISCATPMDCDKSLQNIQQAIKLDPNLTRAYVTRGSILIRKRQLKAGLQDYGKAKAMYQKAGKTVEAQAIEQAIEQAQRENMPSCLPGKVEGIHTCL
ncbi:hypothetical protein H6F89_29340 [Cyanobacteria bacterium FACHB-63]|nr:hypothetical protein [Cyanobacteria bacterium FACHB-63]